MSIPTFEVINLTPAIAAEFLAGQAPNRNKKWAKIDKFARDMAAGRWSFTGEAIKFDTKGRMIDGQNRCEAVVKSGATIQILVVHGLDPSAQADMDQVGPRSTGDALKFAGHAQTHDLAAAISTHRTWEQRAFLHCMAAIGKGGPTNSEALAHLEANPELAGATLQARRIYTGGLRLPVGSLATALVETKKIDAGDSADFFSRILELRTSGHGDPIATLIKRVTTIREAGQRPLTSTGLFLLFRSWNAYRTGETLTKFQLGAPARGPESPSTWAKIPEPK